MTIRPYLLTYFFMCIFIFLWKIKNSQRQRCTHTELKCDIPLTTFTASNVECPLSITADLLALQHFISFLFYSTPILVRFLLEKTFQLFSFVFFQFKISSLFVCSLLHSDCRTSSLVERGPSSWRFSTQQKMVGWLLGGLNWDPGRRST